MTKQLIIQGALYTVIGALTPVSGILASDAPLSVRVTVSMTIIAIISGATALKAFLSTTFADSKEAEMPKKENPPT